MRKTIFLKNLFTLLLLMVISREVSGQEKEIIYFEDFGTTGHGVALNIYDGFTSDLIKPTGASWLINRGTVAEGSFAVLSAGGESELIFDFGDKISYYTNVSLEFSYYRAASSSNPQPLGLEFSTDGIVWTPIELDVQSTGKWLPLTVNISNQYLGNFKMKFVKTGSNTTRIDNIKIVGNLGSVTSCETPSLFSGIYTDNDIQEIPVDTELIINCATPTSIISYSIDGGTTVTAAAPARLKISKDCSLTFSASVGNANSESVTKQIRVLTEKNQRIFTSKIEDKTYSIRPEAYSPTSLKATEVLTTQHSELVLSNLNEVWDIFTSTKIPDSYYIRSAGGKFLSIENNGLKIANEGTAWLLNTQQNYFWYKPNDLNYGLTFFCRQNSSNGAIYFALGNMNNTMVSSVKYYTLEESQFVLQGVQNISQINQILQREDLKWIDMINVSEFEGEGDWVSPVNPNCLVFTSGLILFSNEVVDNTCEILELTDNKPFFAPREFTASEATYSRMAWQDGGWETIILPYAVNTLPADYIFDEFAGISADNTQVTFRQVTSLEANKPYMMKYVGADKTNGQAKCTFTVSNVVISPEMQNTEFTGVYTKTPTAGKFILGVKNGETIFGKGGSKSYVNPFRAYLDITLDAQAGPMRVTHQPLDATGIEDTAEAEWYVWSGEPGEIVVRTPVSKLVNVVSVEGRLVRSVKMETGEQRIEGLSAGLYIVNGKKIVVK